MQCIENLQGMELFSKFDIRWGYNNICIRAGDEWKAAFKTRRGLFEPKVMFFGMSNSPATFQRFMHTILDPLLKKYGRNSAAFHIPGFNKDETAGIENYMDDCGIGTKATPEGRRLHTAIIHDFFDVLAKHGLHLKLSKSVFMQPQMDFLGMRISKDGTTIDPAKIAGLKNYPQTLENLKQARGFLGVAGYHRMFVPNFSTIAAPITRLTRAQEPFTWGPEQQEAQEKLINLITSSPILVKPDPNRQFELEVDASQIGTGAILYQRDLPVKQPDGTEKPGPR
jgi:Reverse transcriptase (RNA-dependent DNA polymerase)/RNase H-like domain found in reverse transcriptase